MHIFLFKVGNVGKEMGEEVREGQKGVSFQICQHMSSSPPPPPIQVRGASINEL